MGLYDIAPRVTQWQAEGRPVLLARVLETVGVSSREPAAAVAFAPGEPLAGVVFSGAADAELSVFFEAFSERGDAWLTIAEDTALRAGLSCGGRARVYLQPATDLPWHPILAGEPVCLITEADTGATSAYQRSELRGDPTLSEAAGVFNRGVSDTRLIAGSVVTALWPRPRVIVVGAGQIADALGVQGALLGWTSEVVGSLDDLELSATDCVVVLDHDLDVSGTALTRALGSPVAYVGALGSRHTQAARAGWLAGHGIDDLSRIHGPAGLDIGSRTAAEIALSIVAEIVSLRQR